MQKDDAADEQRASPATASPLSSPRSSSAPSPFVDFSRQLLPPLVAPDAFSRDVFLAMLRTHNRRLIDDLASNSSYVSSALKKQLLESRPPAASAAALSREAASGLLAIKHSKQRDFGSFTTTQHKRRRVSASNEPTPEWLDCGEVVPAEFFKQTYPRGMKSTLNKSWKTLLPMVARAKASSSESGEWEAYVDAVHELPLNNGGRIKKLVQLAAWTAAQNPNSDERIVRLLEHAASPAVYRANAAGATKRLVEEVLKAHRTDTFPTTALFHVLRGGTPA